MGKVSMGYSKNAGTVVTFNGSLTALVGAALLAVALPAGAAERRVTTTNGNTPSGVSVKLPANLAVPAEWKELIDPKCDVFWNEGNFTPDAGFVVWAKNPTVENAKLYLIRMNAKRDVLHVMQRQQAQANRELIAQGVIANDYDFLSSAKRMDEGAILNSKAETQIFFLFNPDCPHCKRQAQILAGKTNVVPMQVGGGDLVEFAGLPPTTRATPEDIARYASGGVVPVLLIYARKTNTMASAKGVHTLEEIKAIENKVIKGDGNEPK